MEGTLFCGLKEEGSSTADIQCLEAVIRRIDGQIEDRSKKLEDTLSRLVTKVQEIPVNGSKSKQKLDAEKAIEILNMPNVFKNLSCVSEAVAVNCFLNNVVQALERNPGQEENVFQDFVQFLSENGMMLPAPAVSANPISQSVASLNITINEDEETSTLLWERIRQLLKRGFLNKLEKLPFTVKSGERPALLQKRSALLQNLGVLFQAESVMQMYENLRKTQFRRLISKPETLEAFFPVTFAAEETESEETIALERICTALVVMIQEDIVIIKEAEILECDSILEYLFNAYLDTLTDHVRGVLKQYASLGRETRVNSAGRRGSYDSQASVVSLDGEGDFICQLKHCFLCCLTVEDAVNAAIQEEDAINGIVNSKVPKGRNSPHTSLPKLAPLSRKGGLVAGEQGLPPPFGTASPVLQASPSNPQVWQWREEFKGVSTRLSSSVVESLKQVFSSVVEEEVKVYNTQHVYPTTSLSDDLAGGKMDYPRKVAKSCAVLITKADKILPLASIHGGKIFHLVRSSFVDTLSTVLKTYHSRLTQVSCNVPDHSPIQFMYIAWSSSIFIKNHLLFYEEVLGAEPRRPFPVLIRQYTELIEMLSTKIVDYHMDVLRNSIFHDMQSQNWKDQKSFYENERCSFSLEMWNYYLQGMRHDLWTICPPNISQEMLFSVLYQSANILTTRYCRATPSYCRTEQFRADILTILHIVLSHLWSVTSSMSDILCSHPCAELFPELHSLCNNLLAVLAIVGSPFKTLYEFLQASISSPSEIVSVPTGSQWLSWIHPEVFSDQSLYSMPDSQAAFLLFSLMIHQPSINYPLLLQVIMTRNAFIPSTLIKSCVVEQIATLEPADDYETGRQAVLALSFQTMPKEKEKISDSEFIMSVYYILLHTCEESQALPSFLIKLIDKEDSWSSFQSPASLRAAIDSKLAWFECLYITLESLIARILQDGLQQLLQLDVKQSKGYNFTSLSALPCGCPSKKPSSSDAKLKGKNSILCHTLIDLIEKLVAEVIFIPSQIIKFFSHLQVRLHHQGFVATSHSSGLKIVAAMIYKWLLNETNITALSSSRIPPATMKSVCMLAELVWLVLTNQNETIRQNPNLPMEIDTFVNSHKDWIRDKVELIKRHLNKECDLENKLESSIGGFTDVQMEIKAGELLSSFKGRKTLNRIYNYLVDHKDSILSSLSAGFALPLAEDNPKSRTPSQEFNPLTAVKKLGDFAFDHAALQQGLPDWEKLLDELKGLDMPTLIRLAHHRFELRKEETLTEEEEAMLVQFEELLKKLQPK